LADLCEACRAEKAQWTGWAWTTSSKRIRRNVCWECSKRLRMNRVVPLGGEIEPPEKPKKEIKVWMPGPFVPQDENNPKMGKHRPKDRRQ